jgi:long-chain acyl-CoA synthetase
MTIQTLNDVFFSVVDSERPCVMMERRALEWVPISAHQFYRDVVGISHALGRWGIGRGDRIAILSENRPEWTMADFAALLLGAVVVPVYSTLTAEQTAYILRDSGARAIFLSTEKQLSKTLSILDQVPVEKVIVMDPVESSRAIPIERLRQSGPRERDAEVDAGARRIQAKDLATLIYTSGTTGVPKGVMLTHGNMASNIACSLEGFAPSAGEVSISFLPLSHVTARHVDFALMFRGVTLAYVPQVDGLPEALRQVRPTFFVGVPRVYEKVHTQVDLQSHSFPKRWIYLWALAVGRRHKPQILAGQTPRSLDWMLADRLVFSKVRAGMGGQVKVFISGGAPLGRELAEWYATIGIRIHEGYGLTETSPVIAVNTPGAHRIGTVGKPLSNIEVRIADDGEVLVRGPSVFQSYWNQPEETRNAFVDGWFRTGDIGHLDADGFLSITDRKKDLIKTSGGKFIAPQPVENSLKHNPLIAEAVLLGEKRKFPAVLIAPCFPLLEDWARTNQIAFSSRDDLVRNQKVRALYEGIVDELNQRLARFEKLKKVLVVADEFTSENGILTASMKLRRRAVAERYSEQIEQMYSDAELASVHPGE